MDISPRKPARRAPDPVDDWLRDEGYFRKHTPNDPTCLFRAVSEQIYLTQFYHIRVRQECVEFMRKCKDLFEENMNNSSYEKYLDEMSCINEWGGEREIFAMSVLYKREFVVFNAQKMIRKAVTNNGFDKFLYLCQCGPKQYESVFEREVIATAAFCQSLVYQIVYKDVFQMDGIDEIVQKMLHDRAGNFRHEKFFLKRNVDMRDQLKVELFNKLETEDNNEDENSMVPASQEIRAPFPYRVAKALDPNIYRNTDFDIWHEIRREIRNAGCTRWNGSELQVGGKCFVILDSIESDTDAPKNLNLITYESKDGNGNITEKSEITVNKKSIEMIGHIQEISKNEGPVVVFIEELGKKKSVPYSALKPYSPVKPIVTSRKPQLSAVNVFSMRKNNSYDSNYKWNKKQWNSNYKKTKDATPNVVHNGFDQLNSNESTVNSNINKKKTEMNDNSHWHKTSDTSFTAVLKNLTSIDNFSPKNSNLNDNTIEVRPVSVFLDNHQLQKPAVEKRDDQENNVSALSTPSPNNNTKNQTGMNENIKTTNDDGRIAASNAQSSPVSQPSDGQMSPQSLGYIPPPMYTNNQGIVCMSPEGNVYSPVPFYGGYMAEPQPASNIAGHEVMRQVNFTATMSQDPNGSDLPLSDISTLRFFYNFGIESFRYTSMWQPSTVPMGYVPGLVPQGNVMQVVQPGEYQQMHIQHQASLPPPLQNNGQRHNLNNYQQNRRRGDQNSHSSRMNVNSYGNQKNLRKGDSPDFSYHRDEGHGSSRYDYQKSKSHGSSDGNKDLNLSDREQRKNNGGSNGRFKKNNDGRNRSFERPQYQQEYQPKHNNYQGSNYNRNSDAQYSHRKSDGSHQSQNMSTNSPLSSATIVSNANTGQFLPSYGPSPTYTNVQYISNEMENMYPSPGNFYPVPIMAPHDMTDGNAGTYVCAPPENFPPPPPPMSPMYSPYVYPPPQLYPAGSSPQGQENWYHVNGNPQLTSFVPYGQIPITQPPPTINRHPSTTS